MTITGTEIYFDNFMKFVVDKEFSTLSELEVLYNEYSTENDYPDYADAPVPSFTSFCEYAEVA